MGAFDSFYGYDTKDPLGIDRMARGVNSRFEFQQQNPGNAFGPLHSAQWDGFFQALQDQGVKRLADNSIGQARGMFPGQEATPNTYDPRYQTSAVAAAGPSNQVGAMPGSVSGIYASVGDREVPGGWMMRAPVTRRNVKNPRANIKAVGQRGTSGTNQTERG